MTQIAVVYFSGYGHTKLVAEKVAASAQAQLIEIDQEGNISEEAWGTLKQSDAIIFGAPTYMGSTPWQFKKFADASSKAWFTREWQDKIFGGFTVSASVNGDKQMTLLQMQTLAAQHGGIWVSLGLAPASTSASRLRGMENIWVSLGLAPASTSAATRADVNHLGGSLGLIVQCPADAGAEAIPAGDMETARLYGERVKTIASRFK